MFVYSFSQLYEIFIVKSLRRRKFTEYLGIEEGKMVNVERRMSDVEYWMWNVGSENNLVFIIYKTTISYNSLIFRYHNR
jgi:hypothetical protein